MLPNFIKWRPNCSSESSELCFWGLVMGTVIVMTPGFVGHILFMLETYKC